MSDRGTRQHHERRVCARRQRRTPGYVAKYPGKTPGKLCSGCWCCGNPRRMPGGNAKPRDRLTRQELLAPTPVDGRGWDDLADAELRLLGCTCDDCVFCHDP